MTDQKLLSRFEDWWKRDNRRLPLMRIVARNSETQSPAPPASVEDFYTDADWLLERYEAYLKNHIFYADGYPSFDANLGPGSLALYLGAEPVFAWDTVWYKECIADLETFPPLEYDADNFWWKKHYGLLKAAKERAAGRFRVNIPDLIENIDILAAMRGPQQTLYDIMDEPDMVMRRLDEIKNTYFRYYDAFYDLLKEEDNSSAYTAFHIIGEGRVAKIQCDFSAMLSPKQFRQFILPSLADQTNQLNHSMYHLDGPDAIRHVPALMELEKLDALQWTCGAGQPDGGCEKWYPIYDAVTAAGKGLWIQLYDGGARDWIISAERLMERYGMRGLYLIFPDMEQFEAELIMNHAEKKWSASE